MKYEYGKPTLDTFDGRCWVVRSQIGLLYFKTKKQALQVISEYPNQFKDSSKE